MFPEIHPPQNRFQLPIGDWSQDGHELCEWFTVETAASIQEVREAYFRAVKLAEQDGLDVPGLFSEYKEYSLTPAEQHAMQVLCQKYPMNPLVTPTYPEDLARWLCRFITVVGGCYCGVVDSPRIPMLPFYGPDEHGRHLKLPGYGLHFC